MRRHQDKELKFNTFEEPEELLQHDNQAGQSQWRDGYCVPFQEGGMLRTTGRGFTEFGAEDGVSSQRSCESKCRVNQACEQAVWIQNTSTCKLGKAIMSKGKDATRHEAGAFCFAKHGFSHQLRDVKPGRCPPLQWKPGYPDTSSNVQCDLLTENAQADNQCSHWNSDFDLSDAGCWAKCDAHAECTQAMYDRIEANCWIGTGLFVSPPSGPPDAQDLCYAKHGFGAEEQVKSERAKLATQASAGAQSSNVLAGSANAVQPAPMEDDDTY